MTARLEMTNNKNIPLTTDVYLDSSLISLHNLFHTLSQVYHLHCCLIIKQVH